MRRGCLSQTHCVDSHDLGQACVGLPPYAACQVSEVGGGNLLEGLLLGSLQLLDNVSIVCRLGKIRARLPSSCLPGPAHENVGSEPPRRAEYAALS